MGNEKQNLEERTNMPIVDLLVDALKISLLTIPVGFAMDKLGFPYLVEKLSLLNINDPFSNMRLLGCIYLDTATGVFSGVTDRYGASKFLFAFSLFPELFDIEDTSLKIKRMAAKTAIICGGWALGKLGKKLYEFGKYVYEINTNKDGVDLFEDYK